MSAAIATERGLARFEELAALDRHLGVLITSYPNGTPQASVVNAASWPNPPRAIGRSRSTNPVGSEHEDPAA